MCRSVPQIEATFTLTRTALGPICGLGTSRTSAPALGSGFTIATMVSAIRKRTFSRLRAQILPLIAGKPLSLSLGGPKNSAVQIALHIWDSTAQSVRWTLYGWRNSLGLSDRIAALRSSDFPRGTLSVFQSTAFRCLARKTI